MKWFRPYVRLLLIAATLFLIRYQAAAQDDIPVQVYRAISQTLPVGTGQLATLTEAVPIDAWRLVSDADFAQQLSDSLSLASHEPNWAGRRVERKLLESFKEFTQNAEWARLEFNSSERSEYDSLLARLFVADGPVRKPSVDYATFLELKSNYEKVLAEWQATTPAARTAALESRLSKARIDLADFTRSGLGAPIRRADVRLRVLQRYDYSYFGRQARKRLEAYEAGESSLRSTITPSLNTLLLGDQWTAVDLKWGEDSSVPYGYMPNLLKGWCCDEQGSDIPSAVSAVTFELSSADVTRPWLDIDASFGAGRRVWRASGGTSHLSSGTPSVDAAWSAPLTFLPAKLLVVRQIRITFEGGARLYGAVRSALAGKSTLRLGPFAIAGRFQGPGGPVDVVPYLTAAGVLTIPQLQLVGALGEITPKSPDPRSDLTWGDPLPALPLD